MPLLIVALGVLILLLLVVRFKIHAFIALIIVALGIGFAQGMNPDQVLKSIQSGVGGTLGYLALVLGFGAMLGGLIAESGAAQRITQRLVERFGIKNIQWALVLSGFIVGIPLFYTVGFVMLVPLIFSIAIATELPLLYLAIPMVASLSVTHGFLPPHPAPTAIAVIYEADMGLTLIYGLIIAVPTVIIAGVLFGRTFKKLNISVPKNFQFKQLEESALPSFSISLFTALLPVLLMSMGAIAKMLLEEGTNSYAFFKFIGEPVMALLISLLIAIFTLGINRGKTFQNIADIFSKSVKDIAMIMLIIGGGGALKQVLIDSGVSDYIVDMLQGTNMSPLVLAWLIAACLRIALGSATVAALTAAGIALPLIGQTDVSPELLVLATGAGSLTCSQVNDTGFWLFKEYFELSIIDTFKSWTLMETLVSVIGLIGCLTIDFLV
jgi:Gnt-I system high-affinity gluconate transporter